MVVAVVVEYFSTRAAWASIAHHPKVVRGVTRAFVVANANNASRWHANFCQPNVIGFIIIGIYGDREFVFGKLKHYGE